MIFDKLSSRDVVHNYAGISNAKNYIFGSVYWHFASSVNLDLKTPSKRSIYSNNSVIRPSLIEKLKCQPS